MTKPNSKANHHGCWNHLNEKMNSKMITRGQIVHMANFADQRLFAEISEGIPRIVDSAEELERASEQLFAAKEFRASAIIKEQAEEEAAKVLILLDSVRSPPTTKSKVLRGFYQHFAKRIYAEAHSLPNVLSFHELTHWLEQERQPFYLDGPSGVDWIFTNATTAKRGQRMYVDYVRNITEPNGDYRWSTPVDYSWSVLEAPPGVLGRYRRPRVVRLSRALCDAGTSSAEGLACVAEMWRDYQPKDGSTRAELRELIRKTLIRLDEAGSGSIGQEVASLILSEWSFPLWPLDLTVKPSSECSLEELRTSRQQEIELIEATVSRRDPPPAISRDKVAAMSGAYRAWREEVEAQQTSGDSTARPTPRARSFSDISANRELASYVRMKEMFAELSDSERSALLALAWFTRDVVADWPRVHSQAIAGYPTLDEVYQLGQGRHWLAGLERWEQAPGKFTPGHW